MTKLSPVQKPLFPKSYRARAAELLKLSIEARRAARYDDSIFIWVPKNAGSSVYRMLHSAGLVKLNTPRALRLFRGSGRVTFGHMSIPSLIESELVQRRFVEGAFKFALTRDPYERAASLFRVFSGVMANWRHQPTFSEFLQMIRSGYYDRIGPYNQRAMSGCNPQVEWLREFWPDRLYKMEDLPGFVADISNRWHTTIPDIAHENASSREAKFELGNKEKALIEEIYAEDFERLGYPKR